MAKSALMAISANARNTRVQDSAATQPRTVGLPRCRPGTPSKLEVDELGGLICGSHHDEQKQCCIERSAQRSGPALVNARIAGRILRHFERSQNEQSRERHEWGSRDGHAAL